ncbi:regulatory protein RecX [Pelomonas sp. SE-A7]|nr:regulatory protein RecX [Pelomonas sp. SE-A7]MDM4767065.1 regulatory protein RecX [Pelomonas sp. SE-A7]
MRRKLLRIARDRDHDREGEAATAGEEFAGGFERQVEAEADVEAKAAVETEVEQVLVWLQGQGYLNEERFVESRLHLRSQRYGSLRIKQELAQHGLSLSIEQNEALREAEPARAAEARRRKFGDSLPADAAEKARQMRFLAARGFSAEAIRRALRADDD